MGIPEVKFMNAKTKIGEVLLILGFGLFVGGAICYITGQLPAGQISGIGALALIFIGAGAGMKKAKQRAGEEEENIDG